MVRSARLALSAPPGRIADLGTGGGVPGLIFALSYESAEVDLIEVRQRRADFLNATLRGLDLTKRVRVIERRAEEVGRDREHRHRYDLVTSRSFGPPAVVAECGSPLLARGGVLVVSEPPSDDGHRWPAKDLESLALRRADVTQPSYATAQPSIRILKSLDFCDQRFPRRPGVPARKPLW